ncbi:MAG: hypothetical protein JWN39_1867 [Ilumatobacteraceae bacterium]|nr:hypothetical protein [Ilumatobacteraceae bacterium]
MFGRHKLTHDAVATVISCSDAAHNVAVKGSGYTKYEYDLVVDVRPVDAAPFRAETSHWFAVFLSPNPGDQLKARCNPETKDVKLDVSDDPRFDQKLHAESVENARQAQRQADLAAPPGTAPAAQASGPRKFALDGTLDPELQQLMHLEEDERRRGGTT